MERTIYQNYINILHEELILAQGCTEPISIAYAAATARKVLGKFPKKVEVNLSGNMLKNTKAVYIPNADGLRGAKASAIVGILGGNNEKVLEVLNDISQETIDKAKELMSSDFCTISVKDTSAKLYIEIIARYDDEYSLVEVMHTHTNITRLEHNGVVKAINNCDERDFNSSLTTRNLLNVKDIYEFANTVDLKDVEDLLEKQIKNNLDICEEGLNNNYGLNVGSTLLKYIHSNDIVRRAKAYTAAGSDARMNGCTLPVVINSGSGNQGITSSIPILIYSKHINAPREKLLRALVLSDLLTIHIKTNIGRLSAFCGVIVAAGGSSAGLSYLEGATLEQIESTLKNIFANISGVFCDGAGASCAAKIASCVDAAFQAAMLAMDGNCVEADTGIIADDIEETIKNVGEIGNKGMSETDKKIIEIMIGSI